MRRLLEVVSSGRFHAVADAHLSTGKSADAYEPFGERKDGVLKVVRETGGEL